MEGPRSVASPTAGAEAGGSTVDSDTTERVPPVRSRSYGATFTLKGAKIFSPSTIT